MSDTAINPVKAPRSAAFELTVELIRAGKISHAGVAAQCYIEIRKMLEQDIEDIKNQVNKAQ